MFMTRLLKLTLLPAILLIAGHVTAQQTVKGVVTTTNGDPLVGVTVVEAGTSNGTSTDIEGRYVLTVAGPDALLIFSYIGMEQTSARVGSAALLDISMEEARQLLDEVVVTALGFEEKEDQLGYASSTVGSTLVTQAAEPTIINALSGKASGVRISRNSGDPGAGAFIQIRGISTIDRDAQPLIVVDGVPISNDSRGAQETYAAQSRLNDINPNDIESVTVLKGASAAALWGTRALGGVIVIKTKSGQYNKKLSVSYKSTLSIDQISRVYPIQTTFGQGDNGVFDARARDSYGDKISERSGGQDEFNTSGAYFIDQDGSIYYPILKKNSRETFVDENFDQIFQNGHFWENNLNLSGGNDNSTVFASLSDMNQEGIIRNNSDYRRTTARVNTTHRLNDFVRLKTSIAYTKSTSNRIRRGASSSGLYLGLVRTPPDFNNAGYRGDYYAGSNAAPVANRHRSYREPLGADGTATYNNPNWTIQEQESLFDVDRFISSMELTLSPVSWIDLVGRVGLDQYAEKSQEFFTPGAASGDLTPGVFGKGLARNAILNMDYFARASKKLFKTWNASLLVGFNYNHRELVTDGSQITNFIQFQDVASGIRDIDNALPENRTVSSTFGQERTVGVYSSASLAIADMLFLNGTLRAESASTFGDSGDNTFYFPSASLAWQFSKLTGFSGKFLSFGKLRVSYGEVGVQPARYNTSNVFIAPTFADPLGGGLAGGLYGNGTFVPASGRGSALLKPERKKETEIGLDLKLLNNKFSVSGTWYFNETVDMLLNFPTSNARGITSIYTNGAALQNKGLELDLGYEVIRNKNWNWTINGIYSQVRNEVTQLGEGLDVNLGGLAAVSARAIQGYPIGILIGGKTQRDDQGNLVFDENGFPVQQITQGVIGDPNPDWQGSAYSTLSYKNFSLSFLFETYQGADIFAGTKSVMMDFGTWGSSATESVADQNLLDYNGNVILAGTTFRGIVHNFGAGPVALTEAWYNGEGGYFGGGNDELYIEDGSWTRLREISLSYTLNSDWLKRQTGISSAQLSVTGRNLLLWTAFEGNDPDTNLQGISAARGIDYFNNPGTKSYIFTLGVNF